MDWTADQQYSPHYGSYDPYQGMPMPPFPPPFPPSYYPNAGVDPTSPTAPPPPPHWAGYFTNGAPNPSAASPTNYQAAAFNQNVPNVPFAQSGPPPNLSFTNSTMNGPAPPVNSKKANKQQKKMAQQNRGPNAAAGKHGNQGKSQDQRPNKKAKIAPSKQEPQMPIVGETLNQSMQRLGSSNKASKTRPNAKPVKQAKEAALQPSTASAVPQHSTLDGANDDDAAVAQAVGAFDRIRERERAKNLLRILHQHNVPVEDLLREGVQPQLLQKLFRELGLDVLVPGASSDLPTAQVEQHDQQIDQEDADEEMYEPTDEPVDIPALGNEFIQGREEPTIPPSAAVEKPAQESVSQPMPPTATSREAYLAKLAGLRSGKPVSPPPATPPGLDAMIQTQANAASNVSTENREVQTPVAPASGPTQEDLARAREKAKAAFAAKRAAAAAKNAQKQEAAQPPPPPLQASPPAVTTTKTREELRDRPAASPDEQADEETYQPAVMSQPERLAPTPIATQPSPSGGLPGLFMHSFSEDNSSHSQAQLQSRQPLVDDPQPAPSSHATAVVQNIASASSEVPAGISASHANDNNEEGYIAFQDDVGDPGFPLSTAPDIPALTSISRPRPTSTPNHRPAPQRTNSEAERAQKLREIELRDLDERTARMNQMIEQRELARKGRRTATPGTPQFGAPTPIGASAAPLKPAVNTMPSVEPSQAIASPPSAPVESAFQAPQETIPIAAPQTATAEPSDQQAEPVDEYDARMAALEAQMKVLREQRRLRDQFQQSPAPAQQGLANDVQTVPPQDQHPEASREPLQGSDHALAGTNAAADVEPQPHERAIAQQPQLDGADNDDMQIDSSDEGEIEDTEDADANEEAFEGFTDSQAHPTPMSARQSQDIDGPESGKDQPITIDDDDDDTSSDSSSADMELDGTDVSEAGDASSGEQSSEGEDDYSPEPTTRATEQAVSNDQRAVSISSNSSSDASEDYEPPQPDQQLSVPASAVAENDDEEEDYEPPDAADDIYDDDEHDDLFNDPAPDAGEGADSDAESGEISSPEQP